MALASSAISGVDPFSNGSQGTCGEATLMTKIIIKLIWKFVVFTKETRVYDYFELTYMRYNMQASNTAFLSWKSLCFWNVNLFDTILLLKCLVPFAYQLYIANCIKSGCLILSTNSENVALLFIQVYICTQYTVHKSQSK